MRKLLLFVIVALFAIQGRADNVTFTVSDGIDNAGIKSKIESEVSRMLTEINAAQEAGRSLNFSAMGNIGTRVQQSMAMLWENSPFMCTDEEIIEHCLTTGSGYQVRNIPLMMKPTGEREFGEDEYQEAVISFDKQGNIESFYLSISMNLYMNVIKSNLELTDLRRRQLILDYVEQFRTAYNQKDINFLEQIYSDDALIITGRVIMQRKMENDKVVYSQKIQYNKQSKQRYIQGLRRIFQNARYFRVIFDNIEVMRHPTNPNFYGVTLHQGWTNNSYHDEGYLFLLWDFTDEYAPQIHVRTWQPDQLGNRPINKDEIFTLSDFDIH
jgi:hypothetical protein